MIEKGLLINYLRMLRMLISSGEIPGKRNPSKRSYWKGAKSPEEGATEGNRTLDPSLTKRLLCRLSYGGDKVV